MPTFRDLCVALNDGSLKATTISKLKAQPQPNFCQQICDRAWDLVYNTAIELGQNIDRNFWSDLEKLLQNAEILVCMRGKQLRRIMTVQRDSRFTKHMLAMLNCGWRIVWIGQNFGKKITLANWLKFSQTLTKPQESSTYDPEYTRAEMRQTVRKNQKMRDFHELATVDRIHKSGRKRISFEDAREMQFRFSSFSMVSYV